MQKPPDESIVIKLQYAKDNHSNSSNQLLQQQQQHQDCLELNFTLASTGGSSTSALHQLRRLNNSAPQPFASENLGDSSSSSYSSSSSGKQSTTAAALPSGHMVKLQSAAQSTEVNATGGIADIQEIPLLCAVETLLDRVSRHRISKGKRKNFNVFFQTQILATKAMQRHQQRQEHQMSTKECIDALASEYKRGTMTFYSNEVEVNAKFLGGFKPTSSMLTTIQIIFQPIFPKAYNAIVKASDPNLFDTLLQLERSYAQTVNDCWLSHQRAILDSQNRYAFEMENGNAYMDPAALQAALSNQIEVRVGARCLKLN